MNIINIEEIMKMIPHRYPFLLIDRIIDFTPNATAIGIKNVTINEPYFVGHFPVKPVMPGVLIIEAMAQTAAILAIKSLDTSDIGERLIYFMSIEQAKFRQVVSPGDTLYIYVEKKQQRGTIWKFDAHAKVGDKLVAESSFTAMLQIK